MVVFCLNSSSFLMTGESHFLFHWVIVEPFRVEINVLLFLSLPFDKSPLDCNEILQDSMLDVIVTLSNEETSFVHKENEDFMEFPLFSHLNHLYFISTQVLLEEFLQMIYHHHFDHFNLEHYFKLMKLIHIIHFLYNLYIYQILPIITHIHPSFDKSKLIFIHSFPHFIAQQLPNFTFYHSFHYSDS